MRATHNILTKFYGKLVRNASWKIRVLYKNALLLIFFSIKQIASTNISQNPTASFINYTESSHDHERFWNLNFEVLFSLLQKPQQEGIPSLELLRGLALLTKSLYPYREALGEASGSLHRAEATSNCPSNTWHWGIENGKKQILLRNISPSWIGNEFTLSLQDLESMSSRNK